AFAEQFDGRSAMRRFGDVLDADGIEQREQQGPHMRIVLDNERLQISESAPRHVPVKPSDAVSPRKTRHYAKMFHRNLTKRRLWKRYAIPRVAAVLRNTVSTVLFRLYITFWALVTPSVFGVAG